MTPPADTHGAPAPLSGSGGEDRRAEARLLFIRPAPQINRWRAAAYSRFVSLMKIVLPTVALGLVAAIGIWPYLHEEANKFQIGFSALKAREAAGPRMTNPRYVGLDEKDRPFTVTADLAQESPGQASVVTLEMPKADLTLDDGTWLVLTSDAGVFHRDDRNLSLTGGVTLYHDSGYEIRSPAATIDLARGEASSDKPVSGQGPFGDLHAEGFHLRDKGKVINFNGKARLVIHPDAGNPMW